MSEDALIPGFRQKAQNRDRSTTRKDVRPHPDVNLLLKTGQMLGEVLVVTLAAENFVLTLVSRASKQLVQWTHYPELARRPR